jgi:serine phosphatase RsbU (regulator of sigma subunit)
VAPSHSPRREAWILAARLAAALVVCFALLAAIAQACDDPQQTGATPPPAQGPAGGDESTPPPDTPAGDDGSTTTPPSTGRTPSDEGDNPSTTPPDEGNTGGDNTGADNTGGDNTGGDNTGGDNTGGDNTGGDNTGDGNGGDESTPPPSGGSKEDPDTEEPNPEEPAPNPNSLPQVTLPDDTGAEPGPTNPPGGQDQNTTPGQLGTGEGNVDDVATIGGSGSGHNTAEFGIAAGTGGGAVATGGSGGGGTLAAGTQLALQTGQGNQATGGTSGGNKNDNGAGKGADQDTNVVTNTVERLVQVVPDELKAALAALAALSVMLGVGYLLAAMRARRLARQRRELLQEVGLLQTALLPPVPDKVGALLTSVAYRPADGPGAGGDFYDVLPLTGGRVGFILGDVSGHGRGALARTAFMRYTLRAYLEAGLEPRVALQVAGRVIDDNLGGDFATVLLAVHDPETGSLTYATAGHPAPIVVGPQPHDPVTAASSPPIGVGVRTGLRQTTVPLVPGSVAVLFTDGLMEARTEDGILGRERLTEIVDEVGDSGSARKLLERVAAEANARSDDMAAVVVSPTAGVTAGLFRTEQLELSSRELEGPIARRFLESCGFGEEEVENAERDARMLAERFGGVVMHVVFGNRLRVEVLPRNVESIEAASRRVSAGTPQ